jgi:tRNA (guanosine-2'-O-)-methyltransferase
MSRPSSTGDDGPTIPRNLGGTELKRLHRDRRRATEGKLGLLLDGVQNPFNVGAILRTAAAFSVDHLWLVGAPSPNDTKVQKTALGSQRFCTWTDHETSAEAVAAARSAGYRIVGVELAETAKPLHELDLSSPICLAIGHEDRGLSKELLSSCDALGYIPQLGRIASLNVSTATAIACYEARRTAWTAGDPAPPA